MTTKRAQVLLLGAAVAGGCWIGEHSPRLLVPQGQADLETPRLAVVDKQGRERILLIGEDDAGAASIHMLDESGQSVLFIQGATARHGTTSIEVGPLIATTTVTQVGPMVLRPLTIAGGEILGIAMTQFENGTHREVWMNATGTNYGVGSEKKR